MYCLFSVLFKINAFLIETIKAFRGKDYYFHTKKPLLMLS